jgi:WXG100 family type VII secretion target
MFVTIRHLEGSSGLRVGFGTLTAASENIRHTVDAITVALDDLHTDVERRLDEWEGGARSEYLTTKATWDTAANTIKSTLRSLANAVDSANEIMYQTERTNQENLQF